MIGKKTTTGSIMSINNEKGERLFVLNGTWNGVRLERREGEGLEGAVEMDCRRNFP
jgi:hypothetical protein